MKTKIAFIGATGMLGMPVALELVNAGYDVHALVRNATVAKSKLHREIHLHDGDIRNTQSVQDFLQGHELLYMNLNLRRGEKKNEFHAEGQGLENVLTAAKAAGIRRIGFISSIVMNYQGMNGFNWWVFDLKHRAVKLIKDAGIAYTIFYPSTFMENFLTTYRMGNKVMLAGESKQKMYFISAIDFGKQVAAAMRDNSGLKKEYVIQGPDAHTADEAAKIFVDHYTKERLKITKAPLSVIKFFGLFSSEASYGAHIIEALNNYPEKFEATAAWNDLGKPTITLQDFARGKAGS